MTDTQQGYAGQQPVSASGSQFNMVAFLVRQMIGRIGTMKLVQVKAVTNEGGVAAVGFVDVMPMVNQADGLGNVTPHGTIFNLPYFRIQGGANAIILDPKVDDIGLAVISDRDISAVKANRAVSNPGSRRRFDLADGVYIGGILNGVPDQYVRFSENLVEVVSTTKIRLEAPTIELAGNVTGSGSATFTGAVVGASHSLSTHTHTSASPGSPTGPPIG